MLANHQAGSTSRRYSLFQFNDTAMLSLILPFGAPIDEIIHVEHSKSIWFAPNFSAELYKSYNCFPTKYLTFKLHLTSSSLILPRSILLNSIPVQSELS